MRSARLTNSVAEQQSAKATNFERQAGALGAQTATEQQTGQGGHEHLIEISRERKKKKEKKEDSTAQLKAHRAVRIGGIVRACVGLKFQKLCVCVCVCVWLVVGSFVRVCRLALIST